MSTVKSKKLQVGTDASASNNFTIYQPATPDGTLRIGVGNADSPTEVGQFNANGYKPTTSPAFRAYMSSDTDLTDATYTKVPIDTVLFDTTSDFDTTNNRYIPSVAGYYQVNTVIKYTGGTKIIIVNALYKNGSAYEFGEIWRGSEGTSLTFNNNCLVYLNGSTDYIELYGYADVSSDTARYDFSNTTNGCFFSAHLIHQA